MIEVLKLALQVIAEVLDLVHQVESGVVSPDVAEKSLKDFRDNIRANETAVDAAIRSKYPEKE